MHFTTAMIQLPLVRESRNERVRTPEDVCRICDDMRGLAQESFQILCMNSKNSLVDRHMVTLGLADASLVHPREVFAPAIEQRAAAVILIHNHPSNDPRPSNQDILVTKRLIDAGEIIGIKVLDHIIVGSSRYYSFADEGLMASQS